MTILDQEIRRGVAYVVPYRGLMRRSPLPGPDLRHGSGESPTGHVPQTGHSSQVHAVKRLDTFLGNCGEDLQQFGVAHHRRQRDRPFLAQNSLVWGRKALRARAETKLHGILDASACFDRQSLVPPIHRFAQRKQ